MLKKALGYWRVSCIGVFSMIYMAGAAAGHHPEEFIQSIQNDPEAGKKIYQQICSTCHEKEPRINVGAPRKGVESDWRGRVKKGVDGLLAVTTVGINQMPPRGGCFECSDAQLKAAIIYMLPSSEKNSKNK